MQVALKDLEIRGAGNLLGGEQSGHIAERRLRPVRPPRRRGRRGVQVRRRRSRSCPTSGSSCRSTRTCRTTTSRASGCGWRRTGGSPRPPTTTAVQAVREELADRYGPLPTPVENLLAVASFRVRARQAGITEVTVQGSAVRFYPVDLPESATMRRPAPVPENASSSRRHVPFSCPARARPGWAASPCGTPSCWPGAAQSWTRSSRKDPAK